MKPNQGKSTSTQPAASLSAKALEYYRMYSANEELPKYFSGVETDALCRRTRHTTQSGTPQSTSTPTTSTTVSTVKPIAKSSQVADIPEIIVDEVCASPTSSIFSTTNKKQLEWDSGADIGYVNCEARLVQKSVSMPILDEPTRLTSHKTSRNGLGQHGLKDITPMSCGSGDSENTDDTSSSMQQKTRKDILSFLYMKVGLPAAESTPLELRKSGSDPAIYSELTPKIHVVKRAKSKKSYTNKHQRSKQLNTTLFNYEVAPSSTTDVSPQTENITNQPSSTPISSSSQPSGKRNRSQVSSLETLPSKTTYLARYRRAKIKNFAITTPISIECVSVIPREDTQTQTNDSRPIRVATADTDVQTSRRSSRQEVLYLLHPGDGLHFLNKMEGSSSGTPSSMCTNFSSSKGAIEVFSNCNSFEYISGNFQETTKQEATASANDDQLQEKSLPTVSNSTTVTSELSSEYVKGIPRVFSSSTTTTKEDTLDNDMEKSLKMMTKLMRSKKYDEHFKQVCIRKLARRLLRTEETTSPVERRTETDDYKSDENNHRATISTTTKIISGNTLKDMPSIHNESETNAKPSTSRKQINSDWKGSMTMSEKIYTSVESNNDSAKSSGSNPKACLVDFAKREREHQLNWISNEIEHLAKLKNMLEPKKKKPVNTKATISASLPIMNHNLKRTTSVYLITTERPPHVNCDKNCGTRALHSENGEIDFHVHNDLGVRDYKFKEIITKITPRDEKEEAKFYIGEGNSKKERPRSDSVKRMTECMKDEAFCSAQMQRVKCNKCSLQRAQAPSLTASEKTHSRDVSDTHKTCCHSRVDCVSERHGHQRPCVNICNRMGCESVAVVQTSKRRQHGNKTRSRSRTPSSSPSTSITDDTSGYPSRKKPPKKVPHRRHSRVKRDLVSEQSEELSVHADGRKLTLVSPTKSETDTDSSHYESLTKYQSNAKSVSHPSKVVPAEERKLRDSLNHWSAGGCMEGLKCEFGKISGMNLLNLTKKESYKQYKAQKQKEKELAEENKRGELEKEKAVKKLSKERHWDHDRESHRDKDRDRERKEKETGGKKPSVTPPKDKNRHRDREKHYRTSDAEPNSISDDETHKYLSFKPTVICSKERDTRERHTKQTNKEHITTRPKKSKPIELGSDSLHKIQAQDPSKTHRRSPTATPNKSNPTTTNQNNSTNSSMNASKSGPQNHSKTDSELIKRNQYLTKTKEKRCKTDSEVPSFERFTNTEGPWHEEEDEEYDCGTGLLRMDTCPSKPSKTGTVSLQTMESGPILVEKGVMKSNDSASISSRDMKVGQEKPLTKQQAVGDDDIKRGAKETASQIPNDNPQRSGLNNPSATAMISPPIPEPKKASAEKDLTVVPPVPVTEDRPFKMVKDMSQINLRSAVVISSVVTSSVSNPEDNIRRLVLEMPLYEKEEDGLVTLVEKKPADLGKRKEHDRRKEPDIKDTSTFSSLLSCSCLQTSTSRITTTVVTDTEIMCSCCGKCVISSESSLVLGDQNGFCWPCYCQSTKRDWNPADPFFQQPDHMCQCYNKIDDSALEKIRETLRQLAEIDKAEAKNVTSTPSANKLPSTTNGNGNRLVCHSCNKKIMREERDGVKKPVAYLLKFEPGEDIEESDDKQENMSSLQEIRVKVPLKTNKKGGNLGTTTASTALTSGKKKRRERNDGEQQGGAGHGRRDPRNLQDYLSANRPDFVRSAEERRRCLVELAYMREQRCRKYQELLSLSNGGILLNFPQEQLSNNKSRIFTTKQMKQMTAKNYKKLPEVQEKILMTKRERVKQTNKLLVSIFNKKLRETVLRGQASLSTSISVINM